MHGRRSCWLKSIYGQPLVCKLSRCGYVHFVIKQHKVQHGSRASEDNEAGRPAGRLFRDENGACTIVFTALLESLTYATGE